MLRATVILLLVSTGLAGCVQSPAPPSGLVGPEPSAPRGPQVVVALLDTGINPWHEAFRLPKAFSPQVPPVAAEVVSRTFEREIEARGLEAWNELEKDRLYWFEGTRVLAISKLSGPAPLPILDTIFPPDPHVIYDDVNHGTATASVVARTTPHAWILMIETDAHFLPAIQWATDQPWIDVVSSSRGNLGHLPSNTTSGKDEFAAAFQGTVEAGKPVVISGGNEPDPNLLSEAGAPWVISVGGAEPQTRGLTLVTSKPVDVVANFTAHDLARNRSNNETFTGKGTSFGAPLVAGVLGEAIYQLRALHHHEGGIADGVMVQTPDLPLTNRDFRWALNMTARYWNTTDWQPQNTNLSGDPIDTTGELTAPAPPHVPGTPVGPWVEMGWGFVDGSTTDDIVALLAGQIPPPDKRDATTYMERLFQVRSAVWDVYQSRPLSG